MTEEDYNYLLGGSIKNNIKLSTYAYNKLFDITRFSYEDLQHFDNLDQIVNYLEYHSDLYNKNTLMILLYCINRALNDYYNNFSDNVYNYLKQSIEKSIKEGL